MTDERPRLVVMVSGNGSNLQALIDASREGRLAGQVVAVVSNRRKAYALERAENADISTAYVPFAPYRREGRSRASYDADVAELVAGFAPDLVVCAGWMHVFSPAFLDRFPGRVINLHPALPGMFPGAHAVRDALQASRRGEVDQTGVMVHEVVPEVDAGPVLASKPVPIRPDDDEDSLRARIHAVEHRLLVDAVDGICRSLADGTVH